MQRGLGTAKEKSPREESAPRKASDCKMFTLGVYYRCFDANDTRYSTPFFSLSNRLYRMSLRSTVTEQSARDPSGAGPFFAIFAFPVSNVKRMAHVRTCHGRPVARIGPKI